MSDQCSIHNQLLFLTNNQLLYSVPVYNDSAPLLAVMLLGAPILVQTLVECLGKYLFPSTFFKLRWPLTVFYFNLATSCCCGKSLLQMTTKPVHFTSNCDIKKRKSSIRRVHKKNMFLIPNQACERWELGQTRPASLPVGQYTRRDTTGQEVHLLIQSSFTPP